MVDRTTELVVRQKQIRYIVFEAQVTTSDTVTFQDFISISAHQLFKYSDGSDVTSTKSENTLTVTEAGLTDEKIVGIVFGVPT